MNDNRRKEQWHIGKEIPLMVIVAFIIQTVIVIWRLAVFTSTVTYNQERTKEKLDDLSYQVAALAAEKYTQSDAKRDQAFMLQRISNVEQQIEDIKYGARKWQK